jgi:hypothetical protein
MPRTSISVLFTKPRSIRLALPLRGSRMRITARAGGRRSVSTVDVIRRR